MQRARRRHYEIELIPGLEAFVEQELSERLDTSVRVVGQPRPGRISIVFGGPLADLSHLRSAVAAHLVLGFDVPRPRALLGHQHFTRLADAARGILALHPPGSFQTLRLNAAGAGSSVFRRFAAELGAGLGLRAAEPGREGDLLVTVRSGSGLRPGWEALVRLSPRPLSARPWRVCNLPGALNATVAHVMADLAGPPSPDQRFLNLACGSGTLLIERLELGPSGLTVGCDVDPAALECAEANLQAAGGAERAQLVRCDAERLPLPDACIDAAVADLPYGMLVSAGPALDALYTSVLAEATRVVVESGRLVAITARDRPFRAALHEFDAYWRAIREVPIQIPFHSGSFTAGIFVLGRAAARLR